MTSPDNQPCREAIEEILQTAKDLKWDIENCSAEELGIAYQRYFDADRLINLVEEVKAAHTPPISYEAAVEKVSEDALREATDKLIEHFPCKINEIGFRKRTAREVVTAYFQALAALGIEEGK